MGKDENQAQQNSDAFIPDDDDWPAGLAGITERLVIREFGPDEADLCRSVYIGCGGNSNDFDASAMTPEEFRNFHAAYIKYQYGFYGYGNWGVFLKAPGCAGAEECMRRSDTCIGIVGVANGSASQTGELSYAILPQYRRRGYAFEACTAAIEYARECGFERFEAKIGPGNPGSRKLAEKLGLTIISGSFYC